MCPQGWLLLLGSMSLPPIISSCCCSHGNSGPCLAPAAQSPRASISKANAIINMKMHMVCRASDLFSLRNGDRTPSPDRGSSHSLRGSWEGYRGSVCSIFSSPPPVPSLHLFSVLGDLVYPGTPPLLLWAILKMYPRNKAIEILTRGPRFTSSIYSVSICLKPREGQPLADSYTAITQTKPLLEPGCHIAQASL